MKDRRTPKDHARRHVKVETDLSRADEGETEAERVADAGDVGAGQASSYGTEAPADALPLEADEAEEQDGR
jgi:hypothetical protein